MEELIFFAIIIFFSVIDSIARSRKKNRQQGGSLPAPGEPGQWEWEEKEDEEEPYSYEAEASYEAPPNAPNKPAPGKSSEGMIPGDIWEEIAGLARGRVPAPSRPAPRPVEIEVIPERPVETHRVHRAHAGFGTDPSTRARSAEDDLDPLAKSLSADAAAVRRQLSSGNAHQLRQAIVLQELLGPPAALRQGRFEE